MKMKILLATILVVSVAGCTGSTLVGQIGDELLSVGLYRNGQAVPVQLSVVGDVEGITDIKLMATVTNTGQLPLECYVVQTSTNYNMPTSRFAVAVGSSNKIESPLIPVAQFEGTTPNFYVKVSCDYTYADKPGTLTKEGSVSFSVEPDPTVGFDLTFGSSTGETGGGADPDPPGTCLSSGTICSVNSDCCSNSCGTQSIVDASLTFPVYATNTHWTFTGTCNGASGCTVLNGKGQIWTLPKYDGTVTATSTVPNGPFSFIAVGCDSSGYCGYSSYQGRECSVGISLTGCEASYTVVHYVGGCA